MSYEILVTDTYKKRLKKFLKKNPDMFDRYKKAILIMESDPYHPSLRLHKLKGGLQEYFSASINMKYRIIIDFIVRDKQIIPIDIGSHDEVY